MFLHKFFHKSLKIFIGLNFVFFANLYKPFSFSVMASQSQLDHLASLFFQEGKATDQMVKLLGFTGIRVQDDLSAPNPSWPEPKLIIPSRTLEDITKAIQGKFDPHITWIIKGERWEARDLSYINLSFNQQKDILHIILQRLSMGEEIVPQRKNYSGILFLGTTLMNGRNRLAYLNQTFENHLDLTSGEIWLLTGIRPLSPAIGETEENLLNPQGKICVRKDWNPTDKPIPKDEGAMIQWMFSQSLSDLIPLDKIKVVYAEMGKERTRATTETTVISWLKEYAPPSGTYLFISSQPFVLYQGLVLERVLLENERPDIIVEGIGSPIPSDMRKETIKPDPMSKQVSVLLDSIARICYELCRLKELKNQK